jgi:hypothetical protein
LRAANHGHVRASEGLPSRVEHAASDRDLILGRRFGLSRLPVGRGREDAAGLRGFLSRPGGFLGLNLVRQGRQAEGARGDQQGDAHLEPG